MLPATMPAPRPGRSPLSATDVTDATDALRRDLRAFLADALTEEVVAAGRGGIDRRHTLKVLRAWNHRLDDAGWAAVWWPTAYGGRDASVAEQLAWQEEMAQAQAPGPVNVIGVSNIAPAIMEFGTDEQRRRLLGPLRRGDEIWCQGMSEPDAGSDLASLRTAAVADGDDFVVSGQKTWNSLGAFADWCQLYVRTDPDAPKHRGISCLLVEMDRPGIEVRPIRTMAGDEQFAELFFDEVRVPRTSLLGPLHGGWRVAMATLSHERAGVARLHLSLAAKFDRLLEATAGGPARRDPRLRQRLAGVYARIACMRLMTTRELMAAGAGQAPSPSFGSLAKLAWAGAERELADLAVACMGPAALLEGEWAHGLASAPQASIAGGTTEINRTIVGEHGLGLPRPPA